MSRWGATTLRHGDQLALHVEEQPKLRLVGALRSRPRRSSICPSKVRTGKKRIDQTVDEHVEDPPPQPSIVMLWRCSTRR